jgi:antitoxin component YwqK of YwqJK toxin-antitoxin module
LCKDITNVKTDIHKQGALKLVSKWKDGQDSTTLIYWLKGEDILYTFSFIKNTCVSIGASDRKTTPDETIAAFRKRYNEVSDVDHPGYLEEHNTNELETKAYFEDGSMNVGFFVFKPRDTNDESIVYFYSRAVEAAL